MRITKSHTTLYLLAIVAGAAWITGCQTYGINEMAASGPLPAADRPDNSIGFQRIGIENGSKEIVTTLVAKTAKTETWKQSNGCSWTMPTTGFAPTTTWRGCDTSDGTQSVTLLKGVPFPLKVGSRWTYKIDGESVDGYTWADTRDCAVEKAVRLKVRRGVYDAFKIVCDDPWSRRTWYYSPELKTTLRYIKDHNRRGVTDWELVKTISPQ